MNLDKRRAAERSVYVRGFPKASSKEKLLEFFSECGKVLDIWLSGNGVSFVAVCIEQLY